MSGKWYKCILAGVILVSIFLAQWVQHGLNRSREELGLTRITPLENAPPVLAFTTVALGGFRGLIANFLWIRANTMQEDGKYFEMVQLSDWITKLQPHIATVWYHLAWNMAYNISVKYQNPADRWLWVQKGIELLRDEGLKYNPDETLLYRELAWFFQHKMGQNLDDAHMYYKVAWADEMKAVLGEQRGAYVSLLNPKTDEEKERAKFLKEHYKMDIGLMQEVDEKYGPLEWRLPESHAIYWAYKGLKFADPEQLLTLRRAIYQSMQLAFHRGRLIDRFNEVFDFGPNVDIVGKVSSSYLDMMNDDPANRDHIGTAHKNFLKDAVYFLYLYNRQPEAKDWMKYLVETYPGSIPKGQTLDEYAVERVTEVANETSMDKIIAVLQGLLYNSYFYYASGEEDLGFTYMSMAEKAHRRYQEKTARSQQRIGIPPISQFKKEMLARILDPKEGFKPQMAIQLRTALGIPLDMKFGSEAPAVEDQPLQGPTPDPSSATPTIQE